MKKLWAKMSCLRRCKDKNKSKKLEFMSKYFKEYEAGSVAQEKNQSFQNSPGGPNPEYYDRSVIYKCR